MIDSQLCQKENARLIAYRLGRVLRNLEIRIALRLNKVLFTALDCLNNSDMIINIKAALAEDELRKISKRTCVALHQKKARGFKLGKPENFCDEGRRKGTAVCKEYASEHPAKLIRLYQRDKLPMREIAERLNKTGFRTRTGKLFHAQSVRRLMGESTGLE